MYGRYGAGSLWKPFLTTIFSVKKAARASAETEEGTEVFDD